MKSYLTAFSGWFKEHLLGMTVFAILTGVLGNFAFEAAKKGIESFASPIQAGTQKLPDIQIPSREIEATKKPSLPISSDLQTIESTVKRPTLASLEPIGTKQKPINPNSIHSEEGILKIESNSKVVPLVKTDGKLIKENNDCPYGQVLRAITQGGLARGEGKCEPSTCVYGVNIEMTQRMISLGVENPDGSPVRVACTQ